MCILLTTLLACWGHGNLMTTSKASEIKFDLRFEISNLIYPENYAYVACKDPHEQNQTHESTHAQETAPSDEHARFAHARKNDLSFH